MSSIGSFRYGSTGGLLRSSKWLKEGEDTLSKTWNSRRTIPIQGVIQSVSLPKFNIPSENTVVIHWRTKGCSRSIGRVRVLSPVKVLIVLIIVPDPEDFHVLCYT